jgi:hypothetical protein
MSDRYIKIDITVLGTTGFVNQLTHLVHAIIIGHLAKRKIYRPHFLPDYNSLKSVPYSEIIDIPTLNEGLCQLNFDTQIDFETDLSNVEWDMRYHNSLTKPTEKLPIEKVSSYFDETTPSYVDLGSCYRLLNPGALESIIFRLLRFLPVFEEVADWCRSTSLQGDYTALHLRLEDDWLDYLTKVYYASYDYCAGIIYRKFIKALEETGSDTTVYLATSLHLSKNRYSHLVDDIKQRRPGVVLKPNWRAQFPNVLPGREIEALIDFLICRKASLLIGLWDSTFARLVSTLNQADNRRTILFYQHDILDNPFQVIEKSGWIGLNGVLGYGNGIVVSPEFGLRTISSHAPSNITIKNTSTLQIAGYCHPTSEVPPTMTFLCDSQLVGVTNITTRQTDWTLLSPGIHKLEIMTSKRDWAHSIWLIKD